MSNERRRDIDGFPNYCVSDTGNVINKKTGRILKPRADSHNYMCVNLQKEGKGQNKLLHRLVADAFLEQPSPEAWQVDHKNGNKRDNRVSNLEYVTPSENMKRAYANGLNHWEGYNETPIRIVETGEVYKSQADCARAICGSQPNINACLQGRRNTHKGYHFEYVD